MFLFSCVQVLYNITSIQDKKNLTSEHRIDLLPLEQFFLLIAKNNKNNTSKIIVLVVKEF